MFVFNKKLSIIYVNKMFVQKLGLFCEVGTLISDTCSSFHLLLDVWINQLLVYIT